LSGCFYKGFLMPAGSQILTKLICDHTADLILHFKYISKVSVIIFAPDVISVSYIDQLRCDAHPVSGFTYTSFQYSIYVELYANVADIRILSFKSEGRGS